MRAIAWETTFQIALRNCSQEAKGRSVYLILVKGEYVQSSIYFLQKVSASLIKVIKSCGVRHHRDGI